MGYACDSDDGMAAAVLITNLGSGDVLAACPVCAPALMRSVAEVIEANSAPQPEAATDPVTGDETDDDDAADPDAPIPYTPTPSDAPVIDPDTPVTSDPGLDDDGDPVADPDPDADQAEAATPALAGA